MKTSLLICTMLFVAGSKGSLCAQGNRAASMEYLQSSSPLKSGGTVTSYSTPGTGVVTSFSANAALNGTNPTTGSAATSISGQVVPTENRVAANPFPAAQSSQAVPPAVFDPFTSTAPSTIQLPTLGITKSNSSYRPNLFRNLWGQQQAPLGLPPIGPPAANLVPQINPPVGSPMVAPNLQTPGSNSILLSGQNQPEIRFQNMPPGVYYGKGILGQPKAYVDGQPGRNFLRFIFP